MSVYPGTLDSFVTKVDGPTQKIMAAHVNDLQSAVVAVETELGTDPAGSLATLKARLAVRLNNNGTLKQPQQLITVGKTNCDYTTITAALAAISDAAVDKIYTILVSPGEYDEAITLKNYVNIVAFDPKSTKILQQVTDNNVECNCFLNITIESASGHGYYKQAGSGVITIVGDISSSDNDAVKSKGNDFIYGNILSTGGDGLVCTWAVVEVHGNITSTVGHGIYCAGGDCLIYGNIFAEHADKYGAYCVNADMFIHGHIFNSGNKVIQAESGLIKIYDGTIQCDFDNAEGYGVFIINAVVVLQNVKILCTHADAKSIYAGSAKDVYCMSVWANRDDDNNITQKITGGFTFDADVQ